MTNFQLQEMLPKLSCITLTHSNVNQSVTVLELVAEWIHGVEKGLRFFPTMFFPFMSVLYKNVCLARLVILGYQAVAGLSHNLMGSCTFIYLYLQILEITN